MDITPFYIEFLHDDSLKVAEIKPCCNEDNVFYYDVAINNQFQFTITRSQGEQDNDWKIALKNADKQVEPGIVQAIGEEIEKHYLV